MPTVPSTSRPVIYLDSSDFSNLSNADKADWQAHRARLIELSEASQAEFRFSAVHVMEITHVDAASKRWSLGRARAIKDLCGSRCLMYWNELVLAEGLAQVQGRTLSRTEVYRDDGRWTPAIDIAARELRDVIRRKVKAASQQLDAELRDGGASGHVRKSLRRALKGGRVPPKLLAVSDTGETRAELGAALKEMHLPGDPAQVDLVRRMATGSLPSTELQQACVAMVTDLPAFVGHHYDAYGDLAPFFNSLRQAGATLREEALNVRAAIAGMAASRDADAAKTWLHRTIREYPFADVRRSMLTLLGRQEKDALRRWGVSRRDWERSVVESDVGRIPALDIVLDATLAHVRRNASPGAKSKLLDSSFADLLHLAYLPYVDVLRCDAETAQVANAVAKAYGTRVAASFKDVMRLFDSTLQEPRAQPA